MVRSQRLLLSIFVIAFAAGGAGLGQAQAVTTRESQGAAHAVAAVRAPGPDRHRQADYAMLGFRAAQLVEQEYYAGAGTWNMCVPAVCGTKYYDWGADSLAYDLYFHYQLTGAKPAVPIMRSLSQAARLYTSAEGAWSDVPMWDAVADLREYEVTGAQVALTKAESAFDLVDSLQASSFGSGSCPSIDYQRPNGGRNKLKTLETDSNYIKAALLLYQATGSKEYLAKAQAKYAAVRTYFLSPRYSLYTAHLTDNGSRCTQQRGQFYASVNGNMIWSGAELSVMTGRKLYLTQAIATARSVSRYLSDADAIFTDPQVENDVVEPLIEGMYLLAARFRQPFARTWLLVNAAAAAAERSSYGAYGRAFDGPPPRAPVTAWQVNGGIALMFAAARLDPGGFPGDPHYWQRASLRPYTRRLMAASTNTITIRFSGRAIAINGALSDAYGTGHARMVIDGHPIFNRMGIWQGDFISEPALGRSVLFAWRWPRPGRHTITIMLPPPPSGGTTSFEMTGYYLLH